MAEAVPNTGTPDNEEDNLSADELWAIFEAETRRTLGLSGDEFLRRWDAGAYHGEEEDEPSRRARGLEFLMLLVTPERFRAASH